MRRREFAMGTGILLGTARAGEAAESDDVAAVKKTIEDVYRIFYVDLDKRRYRALLADDYLLLEHGELLDIDGDMALMPAPDSGFKRTDTFDFRSVKIQGDLAYAVYYLKAAMTDKSGPRERQWLESAILRRSAAGGSWRSSTRRGSRSPAPDRSVRQGLARSWHGPCKDRQRSAGERAGRPSSDATRLLALVSHPKP